MRAAARRTSLPGGLGRDCPDVLPLLGGTETLDLFARSAFGESRAIGFGADLHLRDRLELGYESLLRSSATDADADHRVQLRYRSRFQAEG